MTGRIFLAAGRAVPMRVALHQFAPEFPGRERNWDHILHTAEETDADVVVFPELTSTGYMYRTRKEIEPYTDSRTILRSLEPIARRHRRLLVGGFAERTGGRLYNSAYVVSPKGSQVFRKIHLWNYENDIFAKGGRSLTVPFLGHRIGVEVCYDLQFPELGSYYARQGTELLLVPMAWAEEAVPTNSGLHQYNHLAIATAFSHGIYVAVCNRVGLEKGARFLGQSSLADPYGRIEHLGSEEGTLITEIDFSLIGPAKRPNPRNDLDTDPRLRISLPSVPRR
jgi:predicted amidohydrolase